MKILLKIYYIVLFLACLNESTLAQSNVRISGKLLTDQQEGTITISQQLYTGNNDLKTIAKTFVDKSGNFNFKFNILKPQVLMLFNKDFYISPGDSVFINVKGSRYMPEKFDFKGRNVVNYIYTLKIDSIRRTLQFKWLPYDLNNGLDKYLDGLSVNKTILLNYLNDFSDHNTLTDDYKAYAFSQILYDYYIQLLYPITGKKFPLEQVPVPYSTILEQIKLQDNEQFEDLYHVLTANALLTYKMLKYKRNELQTINDNFSALPKDFLLTKYAQKLLKNYVPDDSLATKELFKKIAAGITSQEYREYFKPIKEQFYSLLTALPKVVLQTVVIDSVGHKLTFLDVMAKSKKKIIVLDFWASWCGPCIVGMPKVNKIKKNFSNNDVEFVFISVDKTEALWRGGLANTKIPGNHYWIKENLNSALVKFLKIPSIPRYVIINKTGTIEKLDAAKPEEGENGLQSQISKLLKQ